VSHWYDKTGKACHTQATKKGAKNPTRPTNITDARELGLFPSITTIMGVVDNPALNRWKHSRIVEWCFNAPPGPEETLEQYTGSALEKAFNEVANAADLGTDTHANIEAYTRGEPMPYQGHAFDLAWAGLLGFQKAGYTVDKSEVSVVCPQHGYAGTTDCAVTKGSMCGIVDFKTIRTTPGKPLSYRFNHLPQIAAYHVGYWCNGGVITDNGFGANVYISTTEPNRVEVVEYTAQEMRDAFDMFLSAANIWRYANKYDPRVKA
jgi:hypothetical protein